MHANIGYSESNSVVSFQFESTSYSETTSLYSISGNWNDNISSGDQVWSVNRISLGYQYDDFMIQSLYRKDFSYKFDNETVQFLNLINNQNDLEVGKQYVLNIRPDKVAARGIRLGFKLNPINSLSIKAWFSVLQITELLDGQLMGVSTAKAVNDYDISFTSDLTYDEDPLYGRQTNGLSGRGYAIDLMIDYEINREFLLKVELIDLAGELRFENIPFTKANASSNIKDFDEDGYVKYNPSVSGFDGNKDYVKALQGRQKVVLNYRVSLDKTIMLELNNVFGFKYEKIMFQQQLNGKKLTFIVLPSLESFGVNWAGPNFAFGLETDNFDVDKIKYLKLNSKFSITF